MAKEKFPRIREKEFVYRGAFKVPSYRAGRLDLICAETYATPTAYKVFAAANNIKNPMVTRPGIRTSEEALRNELILRGYSIDEVDKMVDRIDDERIISIADWLGYNDFANGNITDVDANRTIFVPSPNTTVSWFSRYDKLIEEEENS